MHLHANAFFCHLQQSVHRSGRKGAVKIRVVVVSATLAGVSFLRALYLSSSFFSTSPVLRLVLVAPAACGTVHYIVMASRKCPCRHLAADTGLVPPTPHRLGQPGNLASVI